MLVLTRKVGESIVIDDTITLTITAVGDGRVKIGVQAPRDVRVNRAEIAARIEAEEAESLVVCG